MISPTSSSHSDVTQTSQPTQSTPRLEQQPVAQQVTPIPQDTVSLSRAAQQGTAKNTGDVDHDADSH